MGLAAFVAVIWLAMLPSRPLFNPDEGRYAEIPREMLHGGDWIIPHLNGVAYIEKPPLQYWATALSLRAFGESVFAARLYTGLCALGTLVVVWVLARGLWGAMVAWRSAAVLAGMLLFVVLGQLLTLDMSLTFYMTLGLAGFLLAQRPASWQSASRLENHEPSPSQGAASDSGFYVDGRRDPGARAGPVPGLEAQAKLATDGNHVVDLEPGFQSRFESGLRSKSGFGLGWQSQAAQRGWMLLAWAAVALGVLTKGLVAAAIPAAVLVLYSLYTRDFAPWRRLRLTWGLPLFAIVAVPWHWLAARRLPEFLQFFFVHEHLARYLTPSADREEAWWFFAVVFALGSMPWTGAALRVLGTGWQRQAGLLAGGRARSRVGRRQSALRAEPGRAGFGMGQGARGQGQFDFAVFLWIWMVFVCVFFSLSDSKLIPYILPAMPALALLIGALPAETLSRDARFTALLTGVAGVTLLAVSGLAPRFIEATERSLYFLLLARPLAEIGVLLGISGLFVCLWCRHDLTRATVFLGVGWCLAGLLLMRAAGAVAPVYSGVVLARALRTIPEHMPLYSVATYDQTLPFYWRRRFELVAYRGELDFGLSLDPAAEIPTVGEFLARWQPLEQGYAVMERTMFEELQRHQVPMRVLAHDVHRVLVARR